MSDKTERWKVLIAGVFSLLVTAGIARFSFTPLLPIMQSETWLTLSSGGWLASFNYVGYMAGAVIAASISDLELKDRLYRIYLLVAVLTTAAMAFTDNMVIWSVLRFFSGMSTSGGMLLASGLILNWLIRHNHRSELGIHFTGIGLGIVLCSLVVELLLSFAVSWDMQWIWFAVFAALLSIPAWIWMPRPDTRPVTQSGEKMIDQPPSRQFMIVLMAAYFCAGYGYVISATFIVDIVEGMPSMAGNGPMVFLVIGLAALPAVLIWDRVARSIGYLKALLLAYGVQVFGIVLPAMTDSLAGIVISAVLYGGTFIGCVSLVLTMAGLFYPTKPAKLMGSMTLAYGAAQIIAPALTGTLAEGQGSYDFGLYLAGGFVALGTVLVGYLLWLERREVGELVAA